MTQQCTKVAFIAPRFHTNQVDLVSHVASSGVVVDFWIAGFGATEEHESVFPKKIKYVNRGLVSRGKGFRRNPFFHLYKYGAPSAKYLKEIWSARYDLGVIRTPVSVTGLVSSLVLKMSGAKILFYSQSEVHRPARFIRDKVLNFTATALGAAWFSPCSGTVDDPAPLRDSFYIPFAVGEKRPKTEYCPDGVVSILMIGKFLPRKRHDLILDAIEQICSDATGKIKRLHLTIVGEHSSVTEKRVFELTWQRATALGCSSKLLKNVPFKEMGNLYRAHDIFVLPSQRESASVSNLEAMAYGLVPVLSSCNKTANYSRDAGVQFESGSSEDLASALRNLIDNPAEIEARGKRCLEIARRYHSPAVVYNSMLSAVSAG